MDLVFELRLVVGKHRRSNNRTGDSTGTAEFNLVRHEDVRDVLQAGGENRETIRPRKGTDRWGVGMNLVFAEQGQVEQNLNGLGVGGHDDELGLAAVQGLGC